MARCKSCGAYIIWIKTESGKAMPCNEPEYWFIPDPNGNMTYITADGRVMRGIMSGVNGTGALDIGCKGRISHFATCPNASQHRRRKNESK